MKPITRKEAIQLIDKHSDAHTVFSVKFVKGDGTERDMNCRFNVLSKLHTDGSGLNTSAHNPKIRTVYDMQKKAYRKFNVDTLKQLCLNKTTYKIV